MAVAKQFLGTSILERSSLISPSKTIQLHATRRNLSSSVSNPRRRRFPVVLKPMAAITEDYRIRTAQPSDRFDLLDSTDSAKVKVRAVVTVRNKIKEDLKEAIIKQLDNLTDMIGRNVVLQIVSTEIDPSKKLINRNFSLIVSSRLI